MNTFIGLGSIQQTYDQNTNVNSCTETGCRAACCRFPVFDNMTSHEFEDFTKASGKFVPTKRVSSMQEFNQATHNFNPVIWGDVPVIYYIDESNIDRIYHVAVVGTRTNGYCPNLDQETSQCKIYEVRPDGCRYFEFGSRSCQQARMIES